MIPLELDEVLEKASDTLSGAVRFRNTRVPLQALLDTVAEGGGLAEFLEGWPEVHPEQAKAVLAWIGAHNRDIFGLDRAS